mmetsp:Transcript_14074/g.37796  ORF Transcript_14074/g.37796 Transcript_14074/m.37796 type:complete len:252 (+) Transcript_14074:270-1025(+)
MASLTLLRNGGRDKLESLGDALHTVREFLQSGVQGLKLLRAHDDAARCRLFSILRFACDVAAIVSVVYIVKVVILNHALELAFIDRGHLLVFRRNLRGTARHLCVSRAVHRQKRVPERGAILVLQLHRHFNRVHAATLDVNQRKRAPRVKFIRLSNVEHIKTLLSLARLDRRKDKLAKLGEREPRPANAHNVRGVVWRALLNDHRVRAVVKWMIQRHGKQLGVFRGRSVHNIWRLDILKNPADVASGDVLE